MLAYYLSIVSARIGTNEKTQEVQAQQNEQQQRQLKEFLGPTCEGNFPKCQKWFFDGRIMHRRIGDYCREVCMFDFGQVNRGGFLGFNCGQCDPN